jgi:N-acetylglucosamine kinase-like BadF-type ATPase
MTVIRGLVLAVMGGLSFGAALAMDSQEQSGSAPRSKPMNLQVLPKEMSAANVGKLMKRFEQDLGVKCSHCHVEDPQTQKLDYVSDENPRKETARVMISMLTDINDKYLAQLGGDRRYAVPVTCGSCHQGRSSPPEFER